MSPFIRQLKTSSIDEAVNLILLAVSNDPILGNAVYALPLRVDKLDVWSIECLKILIMETRAFAELVIL